MFSVSKASRLCSGPLVAFTRSKATAARALAALPQTVEQKHETINRLLAAKEATGLTFDEIAKKLNLTNIYATNLFYLQAQLKPETAKKLPKIVPGISEQDIKHMQRCPMRSYSPSITQEPNVYRTMEAVLQNGEAIKALVNEMFGDGIISAIDFYATVDSVEGKAGERRVVLTFNGKFLPHVEQVAADNTAARK